MSTTGQWTSKADKTLGWLTGMGIVVALIFIVVMADRKANHRHNESYAPGTPVVLGFDPPYFDFGTVPQAHRVEHTFRLVNRGTNDVSITLVRASCLCTVVATNFVGRDLRAGEELLVPVTFDSGQREGSTESSVLFVLDYPGGKYQAEATLRGRVDPEFSVERPALDFGILYPGQSATQTTVLRPERLSGAPLTQTQMNFGPFQVLVTHQADVREKRTNATITVVFSAPPLRQRELFTSPLRLQTLSQRVPQVEIALKAEVVPEVEITPALLVLGPDGAGESRFTVRTRRPSRIIRALTRSPQGPKTVPLNANEPEDSDWGLVHCFYVLNSALADAAQIDVELEVRHGAGETEARLASAQIKRLNDNTNNE
ncbi:MAG: DUF1573 domain-containing protein [Acidobacteria bacterium]|nr:DUF1573 domain-containing protein [Acidobacteriota bacterium]